MAAVKLRLFISIAFFFLTFSSSESTSSSIPSSLIEYHQGSLLHGKISVNLIWYGKFKPSQRAIVTDFIASLSSPPSHTQIQPSVSEWWKTTEKYYHLLNKSSTPSLYLGKQIIDESYSLGKYLSDDQIGQLAWRGQQENAVGVLLTASNVTVDGFCVQRCEAHGWNSNMFPYIWVGNSEACPGFCSGLSGRSPSPNSDVGLDDMLVGLAGLLMGTVTNPFGDGFYRGPYDAVLTCFGFYSTGELLVDPSTGAGYNAHGARGRKYLLPAIYDPTAESCATLV